MNLRRFAVLSGAGLLLFIAYIGGCGGDGQSGNLTGTGGGSQSATSSSSSSMNVCDGQFGDQGTLCTDCLTKNCDAQFTACCKVMYCENLANAARGKLCSGADCYGTAAMPGPIRALIEDVDFGGSPGVPSPAWMPAQALIECTVASCVDPATMKQICVK